MKQITQPGEPTPYKVPENETGDVHALIVREEYDPTTGKPLFEPYVQKWNPQEWKYFLRAPNGFTVKEVLHAPAGTPKTLAALEAQEAKAKKG